MNIHSDQELINGCIRNSRKFQEELYLRFFDKMFGMCLRHTDDEETAMSIMNDGFLNVFKIFQDSEEKEASNPGSKNRF